MKWTSCAWKDYFGGDLKIFKLIFKANICLANSLFAAYVSLASTFFHSSLISIFLVLQLNNYVCLCVQNVVGLRWEHLKYTDKRYIYIYVGIYEGINKMENAIYILYE